MLKIIIADDDRTIREGLAMILEQADRNYQIDCEASDGETALRKVIEWQPDVLITDMKMPIMNGLQVIENIHSLGLTVKIIGISGFDDYHYVRESMRAGAVDYLLKPIEKKELLQHLLRIEELLEHQKKMVEKSEKFEQLISENELLYKERLVEQLLQPLETNDEHRLHEKLNEMTEQSVKSFCWVIVEHEPSVLLVSGGETNLNPSSVWLNHIADLFMHSPSIGKKIWMNKDGFLVVLFMYSELYTKSVFEFNRIENEIQQFKIEAENFTGERFTCAYSTFFYSLREALTSYQQTMQALSQRFYEEQSKIYTYQEGFNGFTTLSERDRTARVQKIVSGIQIRNAQKVRDEMRIQLNQLIVDRLQPQQFVDFVKNILRTMLALHADLAEMEERNRKFNWSYGIDQFRSADSLVQWAGQFVYELIENANQDFQKKDNKIIARAKDYIDKHYQQNIHLAVVAEHVNLNPNYFSDYFKNITGKNFIDYLIERRIEAAKKLLGEHDVKIYDIGYLVGYNNPSSFNRAFKNVVGVTPAEYKKILR